MDTLNEQLSHDATELMLNLPVAGYCNYFLDNFPEESVGLFLYICSYIYIHIHTYMYNYMDM